MLTIVVAARWLQGFFSGLFNSGYQVGERIRQEAQIRSEKCEVITMESLSDDMRKKLALAARLDIEGLIQSNRCLKRDGEMIFSLSFPSSHWEAALNGEEISEKEIPEATVKERIGYFSSPKNVSDVELEKISDILSDYFGKTVLFESIYSLKGKIVRARFLKEEKMREVIRQVSQGAGKISSQARKDQLVLDDIKNQNIELAWEESGGGKKISLAVQETLFESLLNSAYLAQAYSLASVCRAREFETLGFQESFLDRCLDKIISIKFNYIPDELSAVITKIFNFGISAEKRASFFSSIIRYIVGIKFVSYGPVFPEDLNLRGKINEVYAYDVPNAGLKVMCQKVIYWLRETFRSERSCVYVNEVFEELCMFAPLKSVIGFAEEHCISWDNPCLKKVIRSAFKSPELLYTYKSWNFALDYETGGMRGPWTFESRLEKNAESDFASFNVALSYLKQHISEISLEFFGELLCETFPYDVPIPPKWRTNFIIPQSLKTIDQEEVRKNLRRLIEPKLNKCQISYDRYELDCRQRHSLPSSTT